MPEPGKIKKKKPHRFYDYSLLFTIIFLTVFGLIMIYSASSYKAQLDYGNPGYFMLRQAGIAGVSFVAMYIVSKIDYHWFARFAMLGYIVSYVTLLLTRFTPLGVASHGKKRWLRLGPLQFQPTEIVKISLILLLAVLIANLGVRINQLRHRVCDAVCGVQDQRAVFSLHRRRRWTSGGRPLYRAFAGKAPYPEGLSAGTNQCLGQPGAVCSFRRLSGAPGSVRDRFRRSVWKGTGRESSEARFRAGGAE